MTAKNVQQEVIPHGDLESIYQALDQVQAIIEFDVDGTVVNANTRGGRDRDGEIRILQPSGLTVVGAEVDRQGGAWHTRLASVYRTQRRLFEGSVLIPASRYPAAGPRKTPEPELQ